MGRSQLSESMVRSLLLLTVCVAAALAASADNVEDIGDVFAQLGNHQDLADDTYARMSCQSRRGFGECRDIEQDCDTIQKDGQSLVSFPELSVDVGFPCEQGFYHVPMVMLNVVGPDNSKIYQASLTRSNTTGFTANIARVDDVETPVMTCDPIQLCYIAL